AAAAMAGFLAAQALSPTPPAARVITATMAPDPLAGGTQRPTAPPPEPAAAPLLPSGEAGSANAAPRPGGEGGAQATANASTAADRTLRLHGGRFVVSPGTLPTSGGLE